MLTCSLVSKGRNLEISGDVSSAGKFEVAQAGWLWRAGGRVISLGQVRVFDADNRIIPASMHVTEDSTRIVVDGLALAAASYPVGIDPEIGTNDFRISDMEPDGNPNYDASAPAVACNSTNNEYLVVWNGEHNVSPLVDNEVEVYAQRYEFAFAMPLLNGVAGEQFVPFNTFQPSLDPQDADNLVANWIQLTNLESTEQSGTLVFYGQDGGELLYSDTVDLAAYATVQPGAANSVVAIVLRVGINNNYRFSTPVRQ